MRKLLAALALVTICSVVLVPGTAYAAGTCAIFRSWSTGQQLTAADLTASFTTVGQNNMIPSCMDTDSPSVGGMQATQDPYNNGAGPESLAIDLKGELERMRFVLKKLTGWPQWYRYDQPLSFPTVAATFKSISVTDNATMVHLGTTNVGTFTLAGGALTAARTWTLPDISGIVMLTNGGQTVTSGVWNGSIVGTLFGGTGVNLSGAAAGDLPYMASGSAMTTVTPGTTGQYPKATAGGTITWDFPNLMIQAFQ